jgi:hypothetical protein
MAMRKKLCEVTAELVRNLIDDDGTNTWPEFLAHLFDLANSPTIPLRENGLILFALVPGILGNQEANYLDVIKQMLAHNLACEEFSISFHAAKALANFIIQHDEDEAVVKHFTDLVPGYLKIMQETAVRWHDDDALFKLAIEIVSVAPKFLRPHLGDFINLCVSVGSGTQFMEDWRHLAIECCITAAETVPGAMKKVGAQSIPVLVQLVSIKCENGYEM